MGLEAAALGRSAKIRQKPSVFPNKSKKNQSKISNCNLIKKSSAVEIEFVKSLPCAFELLKRAALRDGGAVEAPQPIIRLYACKKATPSLWRYSITGIN
jgi:hypothetical protein